MIDESKVCSKCLKTKPVTEFCHHRARNGYMSSCKMCTLANAKKWRTRKATHVRNAQNEKRKRHPAKHRKNSAPTWPAFTQIRRSIGKFSRGTESSSAAHDNICRTRKS